MNAILVHEIKNLPTKGFACAVSWKAIAIVVGKGLLEIKAGQRENLITRIGFLAEIFFVFIVNTILKDFWALRYGDNEFKAYTIDLRDTICERIFILLFTNKYL